MNKSYSEVIKTKCSRTSRPSASPAWPLFQTENGNPQWLLVGLQGVHDSALHGGELLRLLRYQLQLQSQLLLQELDVFKPLVCGNKSHFFCTGLQHYPLQLQSPVVVHQAYPVVAPHFACVCTACLRPRWASSILLWIALSGSSFSRYLPYLAPHHLSEGCVLGQTLFFTGGQKEPATGIRIAWGNRNNTARANMWESKCKCWVVRGVQFTFLFFVEKNYVSLG